MEGIQQPHASSMAITGGEVLFVVVVGMVLLVAVVCNVLVVLVVAMTPMLRTPTNVLICNLAVSDLLLASLVLPQNLHDVSHAEDSYYEGDVLCRVVHACPLLCIMASIYTMVAISYDRSAAIVLNAQQKLTARSAGLQLTLIWGVAALLCGPTLYEHGQFLVREGENSTGMVLACGSHGVPYLFSVVNGIGLLLLAYLVPLSVLLVNYGNILLFFRKKGVLGPRASEQGAVLQALFKGRMRVVKMLILVAVLFAVSWAPYFVLLLYEKVSGTSENKYANDWGNMLRIALSAFSTAYNFALYILYNRNFRLGLRSFLGFSPHGRRQRVRPSQVVQEEDFDLTQHPRTRASTPALFA